MKLLFDQNISFRVVKKSVVLKFTIENKYIN
jgi:hypothetical protein